MIHSLVELIVLNIGLTAGILDTRVFSMFVLEALILTFATTPVTLVLYPQSARKRVTLDGQAFSGVADDEAKMQHPNSSGSLPFNDAKLKITVVLDKIEHMPALMTVSRFLQPPQFALPVAVRASHSVHPASSVEDETSPRASSSSHSPSPPSYTPRVSVDALRLIELTDRTSALMKSAVSEELIRTDTLLTTYRTFGDLHDLPVTSSLSIVSQDGFAHSVADHARMHHSNLLLLSWIAPAIEHQRDGGPKISRVYGRSVGGIVGASTPKEDTTYGGGALDALFGPSRPAPTDPSMLNTTFVRRVFGESSVDVALYVDRDRLHNPSSSSGMTTGGQQHILFPFFGGPDDRLALSFVVQLCGHPGISATVVRMVKTEASEIEGSELRGVPTTSTGEDDEGVGKGEKHQETMSQVPGSAPGTMDSNAAGAIARSLANALRGQGLSVASRADASIVSLFFLFSVSFLRIRLLSSSLTGLVSSLERAALLPQPYGEDRRSSVLEALSNLFLKNLFREVVRLPSMHRY